MTYYSLERNSQISMKAHRKTNLSRLLTLFILLPLLGCSSTGKEQVQAKLDLSGTKGSSDVVNALSPQDSAGYQRAQPGTELSFPVDYGPHPDYQIEWWYYTGNLETVEGRHFGYQLTFFRRALLPPNERKQRPSDWSADQVYLAHFALSDVGSENFQSFERYARGAAGLAGANADPFHVWLYDWEIVQTGLGAYRLHASQEDLTIQLELQDQKGIILHGDQGYSQKGPQVGNASYYMSQTRLESTGEIRIGEQSFAVSGLSWMDHEFSTSALAQNQIGWDWFSLQLDDGSELMVFQLRRVDGSVDPFSSGTLIDPDGDTRHLDQTDFTIQPLGTWQSPHSGGIYPTDWVVRVPKFDLTLNLEPYLADQELRLSFTYWEGAVQITGTHAGLEVGGDGYVELTGYAPLPTEAP